MEKAVKKIHIFLIAALTIASVIVRTVQLCNYTENSFGYIVKGAEGTIILFYSFLLLLLLSVLLFFCGKKIKSTYSPFESNSRILCVTAVLSGISLFFDFVFRIIIAYNYISQNSRAEMNYFIPLCISVIISLVCAFYFIAAGVSFNTSKYSFREFKYLHTIPLLWVVCILVTCLTENIDVVYAEEELLHYAVLISALVFFVLFIKAVDGKNENMTCLGVFGIVYAALAFVLALPRLAAFINGADLRFADFSTLPHLFTGAFSFALSQSILGHKKKD